MSDYYLGWGSGYYAGQAPETTPCARANSGTATIWFESVTFGLDLAYDTPGYGEPVEYLATFHPAGGGPKEEVVLPGSGTVFYGYDLYEYHPVSGYVTGVRAGVHEITATVNGTACKNRLTIAVTVSSGLYGAISWYAEDVEPPVSEFWTNFVNAEEVQS